MPWPSFRDLGPSGQPGSRGLAVRLRAELILLRAVMTGTKSFFWQFQAEVGSAVARTKAEAKARMVSLEQALDVWKKTQGWTGPRPLLRAWRLSRFIWIGSSYGEGKSGTRFCKCSTGHPVWDDRL